MKHCYEISQEEVHRGNPLILQTVSRRNLIINGPITEEKKEKMNIPLKIHKENITFFLVRTLFLHAERNKEVMKIFTGSSEK